MKPYDATKKNILPANLSGKVAVLKGLGADDEQITFITSDIAPVVEMTQNINREFASWNRYVSNITWRDTAWGDWGRREILRQWLLEKDPLPDLTKG